MTFAGYLEQAQPWDSQPQDGAAQLSGFLTRPEFVFLGSDHADLASGAPWAGIVPIGPREAGLARISSSGGSVALSRTGGSTAAQTQCTFVIVYTPVSGGVVSQQFAGLSSASSGFLLTSTGSASTVIGITKGNVTNLSQITLTAGVTYVVIASHDQVSGTYYIVARPINGGAEVRATQTSTTSSIAGNGTYRVGGGRSDLASANADIFLCAGSFVFEPEAKMRALLDDPWQLFAPQVLQTPIYSAAVVPTTFLTFSLSLAIQQAQALTASLSTAVQAPATTSAVADAAVQAARTAQAALDAAVQVASATVADLSTAVQASGLQTASLNAALQLAHSATLSLDLAVQAHLSATASVNLQVQSAASATASVNLQVQAGSSASVSLSMAVLQGALSAVGLDLAVLRVGSQTAGVSAALQAARSAAAAIDFAIQAVRSVSASVNLQIQDGISALVGIDVAVQQARNAVAGVQLAIGQSAAASASVDAVAMLQRVVSAVLNAAIIAPHSISTALNLHILTNASGIGVTELVTGAVILDRNLVASIVDSLIIGSLFNRLS